MTYPPSPVTAIRGYLPLAARAREGNDVDFGAARLVRIISHPFAVRRKAGSGGSVLALRKRKELTLTLERKHHHLRRLVVVIKGEEAAIRRETGRLQFTSIGHQQPFGSPA